MSCSASYVAGISYCVIALANLNAPTEGSPIVKRCVVTLIQLAFCLRSDMDGKNHYLMKKHRGAYNK